MISIILFGRRPNKKSSGVILKYLPKFFSIRNSAAFPSITEVGHVQVWIRVQVRVEVRVRFQAGIRVELRVTFRVIFSDQGIFLRTNFDVEVFLRGN